MHVTPTLIARCSGLALAVATLATMSTYSATERAAAQEGLAGVAIQEGIDPAQAKQAFKAAQEEMKAVVAELTRLQTEYRKDGSDKRVIEAQFNETKAKGIQVDDRLKSAAFAAAIADPEDKEAREHCGAVVAAALELDAPVEAYELTKLLDTAGAASTDVILLGASAAIVTGDVPQAEAWIAKGKQAGVSDGRIEELEQMLASVRPKVEAEMAVRAEEAQADDLPRVTIETSKGPIVVELFENEAPNTVANFISLVEKGFYDGTPFHRVIGGFMAQGGDPTGTGTGGPGYVIECECQEPGARKHFLGSLSMAHAGEDTGGSQFFLTFRPTEHLDGKHTVFGRVIEGFDVLPKLTRTEGQFAGGQPDEIVKAEVIRKRDHDYNPKTSPDLRRR